MQAPESAALMSSFPDDSHSGFEHVGTSLGGGRKYTFGPSATSSDTNVEVDPERVNGKGEGARWKGCGHIGGDESQSDGDGDDGLASRDGEGGGESPVVAAGAALLTAPGAFGGGGMRRGTPIICAHIMAWSGGVVRVWVRRNSERDGGPQSAWRMRGCGRAAAHSEQTRTVSTR
jgi:hypothetical protein